MATIYRVKMVLKVLACVPVEVKKDFKGKDTAGFACRAEKILVDSGVGGIEEIINDDIRSYVDLPLNQDVLCWVEIGARGKIYEMDGQKKASGEPTLTVREIVKR